MLLFTYAPMVSTVLEFDIVDVFSLVILGPNEEKSSLHKDISFSFRLCTVLQDAMSQREEGGGGGSRNRICRVGFES